MTTVQAFNQLMKSFLRELHETFPERGLGMYVAGFDAFVAVDPSVALNTFMNAIAPHAQLVMTQDASLFAQDLGLGVGIDMRAMYEDPGTTPNTRSAIWNYLKTLYFLGMTVQGLDAATLQNLESVAMTAASQVQATGHLDFASVMNSMSSILGENLPKNFLN